MLKFKLMSIAITLITILSPIQADSKKCKCNKEDILTSWSGGKGSIKEEIIKFVEDVTDEKKETFVPITKRIATFDMDGTIICEKPEGMVIIASLDFLKNVALKNEKLREIQPYKIAYDINLSNMSDSESQYLSTNFMQVLNTAYMNFSQKSFSEGVSKFIKTTNHPKFNEPYIDLIYKPMVELIDYLKANNFDVYIVSGSWQAFVRVIGREKLNFSNHSLIGSKVALNFEVVNGKAKFIREGDELAPANVSDGKAENIYYHIGEIPILAFGNSSGDEEMYQYTSTNSYKNLVLSLEHDDKREYIYKSSIDFKANPSWHRVSMKDNFKEVFINP